MFSVSKVHPSFWLGTELSESFRNLICCAVEVKVVANSYFPRILALKASKGTKEDTINQILCNCYNVRRT